MADLRFLTDSEPRNPIGEWAVRGRVAVFFIVVGMRKCSSDPGSHWVKFFEQIGAGVWFWYFTAFRAAPAFTVPRYGRKGRLKAGCGQDCPPHKCQTHLSASADMVFWPMY
jgi:hypothetical protein